MRCQKQLLLLLIGQISVGGVHGISLGIQENQGAPGAVKPAEQVFQTLLREIQHQDAGPHPAGIFDGIGSLKPALVLSVSGIRRRIVIHLSLRSDERLQQTVEPGQGRRGHLAVGGEAEHSAHIIDGKHRVCPQRAGRGIKGHVQLLDRIVIFAVDEDGGRRLVQALTGQHAVGEQAVKQFHCLPALHISRRQSLPLQGQVKNTNQKKTGEQKRQNRHKHTAEKDLIFQLDKTKYLHKFTINSLDFHTITVNISQLSVSDQCRSWDKLKISVGILSLFRNRRFFYEHSFRHRRMARHHRR